MHLGLELGADVPFFIFGQSAFARGIGDQLVAVTVPPTWALVLAPPVSVSTAAIFSAPELTRNSVSAKILVFPEGCGRNDLQAAAVARFPEIAQYASMLGGEGAPRMTGSGACVFAVYPTEQQARRAHASLPGEVAAFVARALGRHPLWNFAAP
jgi:4-diphosphocytidyl-2-C-methyl-D-erythritol kinase